MLYLKKGLWALFIPLAFTLAATLTESPIPLAGWFVSSIIVILLVPLFKGRENLWMFIMTALSTIPLNLTVICFANEFMRIIDDGLLILDIFRGLLWYPVLFSVEQLVFAAVIRVIRPKQHEPLI